MTKRMLIDATHAEETRVVVLDGNRLEDFDVETSTKKQLKGNIYLAKVVRVEPSLQAAFVEYGGNRHGFLAFGEIHPDYYQIPVADRQRLLRMQAEQARAEEEEDDDAAASGGNGHDRTEPPTLEGFATEVADETDPGPGQVANHDPDDAAPETPSAAEAQDPSGPVGAEPLPEPAQIAQAMPMAREMVIGPDDATDLFPAVPGSDESGPDEVALSESPSQESQSAEASSQDASADAAEPESDESDHGSHIEGVPADQPPPETIGGEHDTADDMRERRGPPRFLRNYKIQEVIRRRQILLVQVVKEERGTKGAALTTYISLAGRYCVLMPNSPRGGGISRKITSAADRRRLKEITSELEIPDGMGLIVRTAGANRPKPEIKRDCEYLMRLWDDIRETTLRSIAPALIYEEASLIKRAIRDVYSRDVDEVVVDGEAGWRAARDFMRMLMPTHAKKVIAWREGGAVGGQPLFARHQVEAQLDSMLQPTVQLRSGGYLVINQTEALVAIDVNSGRSTRERGIEETALRTNLEAADEVARQLRLRDLAGLIVIDFIDMEAKKHNAMVERRLKEALKNDRARIQVGHISHFGLLEMSRQRLRPSLAETSFVSCPHCGGLGHVRSVENASIHVLRQIEEEGGKRRAAEILVHVASAVALYILNNKRDRLAEMEMRYGMRVTFQPDDTLIAPEMRVERLRAYLPGEAPPLVAEPLPAPSLSAADEEDEAAIEADAVETDEDDEPVQAAPGATGAEAAAVAEENERRRRRRRRRRRGGRREDGPAGEEAGEETGDQGGEPMAADAVDEQSDRQERGPMGEPGLIEPGTEAPQPLAADETAPAETDDALAADQETPRRRGRRGGRRRRREEGVEPEAPVAPVYTGPTPADPFGSGAFDIFDVIEQAEQAPEPRPAPSLPLPMPESPEAVAAPPQDIAAPSETGAEAELPEIVLSEPEPSAPAPLANAAPETETPAPAMAENLPGIAAVPAEPEPEPEPALAEADHPEASPAIKPILVGAEPQAEKKRGWWRR